MAEKTTSSSSRPMVYLPTVEAYDRWAEVYDTDNNILQAVDTQELETLLPRYLSLIQESYSSSTTSHGSGSSSTPTIKIIDLGCGTGRNTLKLMETDDVPRIIVGLDASPKMLEIAKKRCSEVSMSSSRRVDLPELAFEVFDAIATQHDDDDDGSVPSSAREADGVLSTLVLEHIPLTIFFRTVHKILKVGGHLLLTNMHPDMGARSQAGFVDPVSGVKIRPQSFVYTIDEVLQEASRWGMRLVEEVRQRGVRESDMDALGDRSRKWVGTMVWFGLIFLKS